MFMHHVISLVLIGITSLHARQEFESEECSCKCSTHVVSNVCQHLKHMQLEIDANAGELKKWSELWPFLQHLKRNWREEIIGIVETEVKKYFPPSEPLPKPENLIAKFDGEMLNDSGDMSTHPKYQGELAENVSNLIAKVEMVENKTMEVEEGLRSERRVRRHLEQEVKETQTSLTSLGDQLHNATTPVDEIMNLMQTVIFTSLEDMNKTIYEDHLQKLYYKVDGVAYQNETRKLDERLEHIEVVLRDDSNDSIVTKLADGVKNVEEDLANLNNSISDNFGSRIMKLEVETARNEAIEALEEKLRNIKNDTEIALTDIWNIIQEFESFRREFQYFTQEWEKSLHSKIEELENRTSLAIQELNFSNSMDDANNFTDTDNILIQPVTETTDTETSDLDWDNITQSIEVTTSVRGKSSKLVEDNIFIQPVTETTDTETSELHWDYITQSVEVTSGVRDKSSKFVEVLDMDNITCSMPEIGDQHLMVEVDKNLDGMQTLKFGCRPIGQYVVKYEPIPVRCEMGSWIGPFPSCEELLDESLIKLLSELLKKEQPCSGLGAFSDPIDCSKFFKCGQGRVTREHCPSALHFNANLEVCDYPQVAGCIPNESKLLRKLQEIIPPIVIEPNNLDKPGSLLGTGPLGQLIVHPRSNFHLHCLFPETAWGMPTWHINQEAASRDIVLKVDSNKISLTVTAAKEKDSGIYRCVTPFGKEHSILVNVVAVHCPSISLDEKYEEVYYRPTPEGEHRILGTTVEFQCEEGHIARAVCMASGNWSKGLPDPEECTLKKKKADSKWKCKPLDTSKNPYLILERRDSEKIVTFRCAGRMSLRGNSFTRCRDDGLWSHVSLPKCIK